ncbi:MAG: glycosyltransferase [Ramlibacter sp.]
MPDPTTEPRPAPALVSVIIPCYNVRDFVEDAVSSALDQTYANLDVVVVDDGSTDDSADLLRRLASRRDDQRLRIISQKNRGLAGARNTGLRHAWGELIAFLDADDLWSADKVARHVSLMAADETIGLSFSDSAYLNENGSPTGALLASRKFEPTLHDMLRRNHFGNGSSVVARRQCFALAGCFNEDLRSCEDYEMWCRILWATSYKAVRIPGPLTYYRLRHASLSFNALGFVEQADRAIHVLEELMPFVPRRVFRMGHAEHYRIAAWKALLAGNDEQAWRLLWRALQLYPWLAVLDFRPAVVAGALALPSRYRAPTAAFGKRMLSRATS